METFLDEYSSMRISKWTALPRNCLQLLYHCSWLVKRNRNCLVCDRSMAVRVCLCWISLRVTLLHPRENFFGKSSFETFFSNSQRNVSTKNTSIIRWKYWKLLWNCFFYSGTSYLKLYVPILKPILTLKDFLKGWDLNEGLWSTVSFF